MNGRAHTKEIKCGGGFSPLRSRAEMNRMGWKIPALGLIVGLILGLATGAGAAEMVQEINIEGTRRVDPDAVRMVLETRAGEPFSAEVLRRDVKKVFGLGYFDEVWVEREDTPGGAVLTFRLQERPW